MTEIVTSRALPDADQLLVSDPSGWLPAPARPNGAGKWIVTLHLGRLSRSTLLELGPVWTDGTRTGRSVQWQTVREQGDTLPFEVLLPPFRGGLVADGDSLQLRGRYTPPAGAVGRTLDLLFGRLARRSLHRLLDDIAAARPRGGVSPTR
jgi:hypothetical protein